MNYQVELLGQLVDYELTIKRVKNINLRVHQDGRIAVSCNKRTSRETVERFMRDKAVFILEALKKSKTRVDNSGRTKTCQDGETIKIFGRPKTLRVLKSTKNRVLIDGDMVYLEVRDPDNEASRVRTYTKWKHEFLKDEVLNLSNEIYKEFEKLGVKPPKEIRFRTMKSRWGSCMPKSGILCFNYNLFETPPECVRYVVIHEYAHFIEPNHSPRFYKQVERLMPDWEKWRKTLNEY